MNTPMSPAASMALTISSRGSPSVRPTPISVPGSPPHDPAVGAATMTPIALFTSMIAVMYLVTLLNRSLGRSVLFRRVDQVRLRAEDAVGVLVGKPVLDGLFHDADQPIHLVENVLFGGALPRTLS